MTVICYDRSTKAFSEGTFVAASCGSCSVVFPKNIRQRETKLTVCAKIMPKVMQGIDLILGMDHLKQFDMKLDCQRNTIEVHKPEVGKAENKKNTRKKAI